MKKFKNSLLILSIIFVLSPFSANAQSGCIRVDQIAKWEVLDSNKTVIYDTQGNSIAFVIFYSFNLKKSGEIFRFFSPTICSFDRVQTSSGMNMIQAIELIRR